MPPYSAAHVTEVLQSELAWSSPLTGRGARYGRREVDRLGLWAGQKLVARVRAKVHCSAWFGRWG